MQNTLILSPSKINLYLEITGKRSDGFHNLFSLFLPIPWQDQIVFQETDDQKPPFTFTSSDPLLVDDNSILHAAGALLVHRKRAINLKIHLEKKVPYQAGLGSASANAAKTLLFLNELWECGFSLDQLSDLAASISSDAPFFLHDSPAVVEGKGEKITPLKENPLYHILIIKPKSIALSTAWAYRQIAAKKLYSQDTNRQQAMLSAFKSGDASALAPLLFNSFEEALLPRYDYISATKKLLIDQGALNALLSGSGSSLFGLFPDLMTLENAARFFHGHFQDVYHIFPCIP